MKEKNFFIKWIKTLQHFHPTPLNNPFHQSEKHSPPTLSPPAQYSAEPDPHQMIPRNRHTSFTRAYYDQSYPTWFKNNHTKQ